MKKIKNYLLLIMFSLSFVSLISCGGKANTYTITWKDSSGNIIKTLEGVENVDEAKYDGATPTKASTAEYSYTFDGWDKKEENGQYVFTAKFSQTKNKYNVKFVDEDGTVLKDTKAYEYGTSASNIEKPANPTKASTAEYSYEFNGWDSEISNVTKDVTYKATYKSTKNKYTITWVNYDDTVLETDENVEYGTTPSYDGETPTKADDVNYRYMFEAWGPTVVSVNGNATYKATFTSIPFSYHVIDFNSDGGSTVSSQSVRDGLTANKPDDPTKEGYEFAGWYDGDEKWDFKYAVTEDVSLKAKWNIKSYQVSLSYKSSEATITGAGNYNYNSNVTIKITPKDGYKYLGLYKDNSLVTDKAEYSFKMPAGNVSYVAKLEIITYELEIENLAEGVQLSGTTAENKYPYNTSITLTASNIPDGYLITWQNAKGDVETGTSFTFNMPAENTKIIVNKIKPSTQYVRDENVIYFGKYPQTLVADNSIITTLNEKAGALPSATDLGSWKAYDYYINWNIEKFMYYIDVDIDENGSFDYRGVYFTKYRPRANGGNGTEDGSYQDENGYEINHTYWFKYESIEWKIIKEEDGKALLLANLILDSSFIYRTTNQNKIAHNGGTGYTNNYELSDIRIFLNDMFYKTVFNNLEKALVSTVLVNNHCMQYNSYNCDDTNDKIFLIDDTEDFYKNDIKVATDKLTTGTDYAKAQGLDPQNQYWTRRPDSSAPTGAAIINSNGYTAYTTISYACYGVRPALWIIL